MDSCGTYKRISTIHVRIVLGRAWGASYHQRTVVYDLGADSAGIEDLSAQTVGGTVESEGGIGEREAISAIESAALGRRPGDTVSDGIEVVAVLVQLLP